MLRSRGNWNKFLFMGENVPRWEKPCGRRWEPKGFLEHVFNDLWQVRPDCLAKNPPSRIFFSRGSPAGLYAHLVYLPVIHLARSTHLSQPYIVTLPRTTLLRYWVSALGAPANDTVCARLSNVRLWPDYAKRYLCPTSPWIAALRAATNPISVNLRELGGWPSRPLFCCLTLTANIMRAVQREAQNHESRKQSKGVKKGILRSWSGSSGKYLWAMEQRLWNFGM